MLRDRRAPLIVGGIVLVLALLMVFLLVLPKMGQVSQAQEELDVAAAEQITLESNLTALEQAEEDAPEARATIEEVDSQLPPTADEPGLFLLLDNAAAEASVDILTLAPSQPVFDPATGLSSIAVAFTAEGSYFAITEFLFNVETLPRAALVEGITLTTQTEGGSTAIVTLTATGNITVYTQDASAGPGSVPGPTSAEGVVPTDGVVVPPPAPESTPPEG